MTPALFEGTPLAGGGTSSAYLPSVFFVSPDERVHPSAGMGI